MLQNTNTLVTAICLDVWPNSTATIVDFGITSQAIYEAYHKKIRSGEVTPEQLDAALGNGPELTKLMEIHITTLWDDTGPEV